MIYGSKIAFFHNDSTPVPSLVLSLIINDVYFLHRQMADGIENHIAGKPPFPRFGLEPYIGFRPDNKERYALRTY